MAYVTQEKNRTVTLAAVGALHVAAIYALVVGLAGVPWIAKEDDRTVGVNIPLPKVTPDPIPQPSARPTQAPRQDQRARAGDTVITTTTTQVIENDGEVLVTGGVGTGTNGGETTIIERPIQQTVDPVFPPKLARPIGKPGLWVTTNDYPANALRLGQEGVTRFQLTIGTDGKVQSCEITVSSGYPALDQAACTNLRKRGKFVTATGPDGAAVPGTYSNVVRWTLPKDY